MIEEAENLKTLVVENKGLRQELDKLKADHEKSIAQVLESSSMATDERDRKIVAQDKIISDLKNELGREKDMSQALRAELQSLREEKTKIDDVIFGTFHLSDLSFLRLLHDYRQSLEDIGESLRIPDIPSMLDFEVWDRAKEMPQLVRD